MEAFNNGLITKMSNNTEYGNSAILILISLLVAIAPNTAYAAKISECQGFGGSKLCFAPDDPKTEGKYENGIVYTNACRVIKEIGGKAHNGWKYEMVADGDAPTLTGKPRLANYCTGFDSVKTPRLYAAPIGCSGEAELVDSGSLMLCVPRDVNPKKNLGKACRTQCGNPINFAIGNKYQEETDYSAPNGLDFVRNYNSIPTEIDNDDTPHEIGKNWRHSFKYAVKISTYSPNIVNVYRPNGVEYGFFNSSPADSKSGWKPSSDIKDSLARIFDEYGKTNGWQFRRNIDDAVEHYDESGKIKRIVFRNGNYQMFSYSDANTSPSMAKIPGLLLSVADRYGRKIKFQYDSNNQISKMTDPSGGEYIYAFDEGNVATGLSGPKPGLLSSVTFPDGSKKKYWYNESKMTYQDFEAGLTGITDENGDRYATFKYGPYNKANSTEHGNGVNRYTIEYGFNDKRTVTDPLGMRRTYKLTSINQVGESLGESQSSASKASVRSRTFDLNGNISSETYFDGSKDEYLYNLDRNLQVKRTEAIGTPAARTTTTQWHETYSLPIAIHEPMRLTKFTYDLNGNLIVKTIQSTNDNNGSQGSGATAIGLVRTWQYTYNEFNQIVKSVAPTGAETNLTYDDEGNMTSSSNPLGQVTLFGGYDKNGRPAEIIHPNGVTERRTYTVRGWLKSTVVNGKPTSYEYDAAGQLKLISMPDGTSVTYGYDAAHRLVSISDNFGNSIFYNLDAAGNRISEEVKDPEGRLTNKVSRKFDILGQVQEQIGSGI